MVSVVNDAITFSDPEFHKREMMLIGSRNATRQDFDHVVACILDGTAPLSKLVTHRTTLSEAARDVPHWAREKSGLVKAVIQVAGGLMRSGTHFPAWQAGFDRGRSEMTEVENRRNFMKGVMLRSAALGAAGLFRH